MKTEVEGGQSPTGAPESVSSPKKPTALSRVGHVGLSIINPFSDVMVIYRTGLKPIGTKLRALREQLVDRSATQESLSWAEAVERSGRSVEQLLRTFRRIRTVWWLVMVLSGAFAALLFLMLIGANISLPLGTLIRAVITDLVLASISSFSLVKVLSANFRLWQLNSGRVSVEERGTFQDYRAENKMWFQLVSPKLHIG